MKLVIFGRAIDAPCGSGHAMHWRGLCNALSALGHRTVFFERDFPHYAGTRDAYRIPDGEIVLYREWSEVREAARRQCADADVVIVTSDCADAIAASRMAFDGASCSIFYDLDPALTLECLDRNEHPFYVPEDGLHRFDLVLSNAGGGTLEQMQTRLGARVTAPLYGHVDADMYQRVRAHHHYLSDLSFLGAYSAARQSTLLRLFAEPARRRPKLRFLLAGSQYPLDLSWSSNIYFILHLPPEKHARFFCSSRCTLNLTHPATARFGWCPSRRIFEATACGAALASDVWPGIESFYEPGKEIVLVRSAEDVLAFMDMSDGELSRIGAAARVRVLEQHTSMHRAAELLALCSDAFQRREAIGSLGLPPLSSSRTDEPRPLAEEN